MPADQWRTLSREWLDRARDDAIVVRLGVRNRKLADRVYGFHAQQAVEKALKGVLAAQGVEPPRTHDLQHLARLVERAGVRVAEEVWAAVELTPYAAAYRYPGAQPPGKVNRTAIQKLVVGVLRWVTRVAHAGP